MHIPTDSVRRVLTEDTITVARACDLIAETTGQRPDRSTVHRWCLRGVSGSRLDHVRVGNRIITSVEAVARFLDERTACP